MTLSTRKILQILSESATLNEDLGTLEFIDKSLRATFQNYKKNKLADGLTSDSPVKREEAKVAAAVARLFDDKNVFGIILATTDGEDVDTQYVAITKKNYGSYQYGEPTFEFNFNTQATRSVGYDSYSIPNSGKKAVVAKLVSGLAKAVGTKTGKMLFAYVISSDRSKDQLRKDRRDAKSGSMFFTPDLVRKLKGDLQSRLASFKASKGDKAENLEAAMEVFKQKISKDITIGGYAYKLSNSNLHLDNLLKTKEDGWGESTLTYNLYDNEGNWRRLDKWVKENPEATEEERKAFSKTLPPRSFEVILKLQDMRLVPIKLKVQNDF